jgi:serine/threonine-protein kinase
VDPPSIRTLRPDVPPAFEAVVMRCMAREPSARFQSVRELSTALLVFASDQARAMAIARGSKPGLSGGVPVAATIHQEPVTASTTPNTAAPWAGTMSKSEGAGRSRVVQIVAVSVLGLLVGILGVTVVARMVLKHPDAAASESPAVSAASASATPTPAAAPPAPSSAALAVAPPPVVTPPKPPAAATPPRVSPPTPRPPPPPVTPAPSPPPTLPASKCSPNYYFDKDGNKHFKPECF